MSAVMADVALPLRTLPYRLAVCRLPASAPVPAWALEGEFWSVQRTPAELSFVVEARRIPAGVPGLRVEGPWRALEVEGPLDFALTGILESLARPLAEAEVSIFALSTFDTDLVLVKADAYHRAVAALEAAGHTVAPPPLPPVPDPLEVP